MVGLYLIFIRVQHEIKEMQEESFNVELAVKVGIPASLLLNYLNGYALELFYETYNTYPDFESYATSEKIIIPINYESLQQRFPYLTKSNIKSSISKLKEEGYIDITKENKIDLAQVNYEEFFKIN